VFRLLTLPLLLPFARAPESVFRRVERAAEAVWNLAAAVTYGRSHGELVADANHRNLLTAARLTRMLHQAGFRTVMVESESLYPRSRLARWFDRQEVGRPNIYGSAQ
jgi:hypothetical protein